MRTGGLNEILKTLLDNDNKGISNQELICLLQKIQNDATEIYHAKYGLDEKIKFNIDCDDTSNANLIGRQSAKSLQCIRPIYQEKFGFNGRRYKNNFSIVFNRMWRMKLLIL